MQRCAPLVSYVACQVLRDLLELLEPSAHGLLCSRLRGASSRASLSQERYDRHRQATNVPAEGTEAHSKVIVPSCTVRLLCIFLCAFQACGHEYGARSGQGAGEARVQHALAGVIRISSAVALRGASTIRKAMHLLARIPVCLVSGSADEEVR